MQLLEAQVEALTIQLELCDSNCDLLKDVITLKNSQIDKLEDILVKNIENTRKCKEKSLYLSKEIQRQKKHKMTILGVSVGEALIILGFIIL